MLHSHLSTRSPCSCMTVVGESAVLGMHNRMACQRQAVGAGTVYAVPQAMSPGCVFGSCLGSLS